LTIENVRGIHPDLGLPAKYLDMVMGMVVKMDVARGTALEWEIFK